MNARPLVPDFYPSFGARAQPKLGREGARTEQRAAHYGIRIVRIISHVNV